MNRQCPEVDLSDIGLEYFNTFFKLRAITGAGMSGIEPLQPGAILDWCRATETELTADERIIMLEADKAYRGKMNEMMALHREADKQRAKGYRTNGHSDDRI